MSSEPIPKLFPAADRKTVAAREPLNLGVTRVAEAEACPETKRVGGRPRKDAETRFREALNHGVCVNTARKRSGIGDARALEILSEIFDALRRAA